MELDAAIFQDLEGCGRRFFTLAIGKLLIFA